MLQYIRVTCILEVRWAIVTLNMQITQETLTFALMARRALALIGNVIGTGIRCRDGSFGRQLLSSQWSRSSVPWSELMIASNRACAALRLETAQAKTQLWLDMGSFVR
jgi:hypothetical protein